MKAMNDMRIQASSNDTLSAIDHNGRTFNTHIAEMHAEKVCLNINDVEFYEWALENKFARLWYCHDLQKSEILKLAIENAINRSPHDLVQRCLFQNEKRSISKGFSRKIQVLKNIQVPRKLCLFLRSKIKRKN